MNPKILNGARVLIAEADPLSCEKVRQSLRRHGVNVETAWGGLECMEQVRTFQPDVLVIELEIPWGGGDGVIARLRDDNMYTDPPALLIVGNAPVEALAARSGVAAENCHQKPFRIANLLYSIQACLAAGEPSGSAEGPLRIS